MQKQHIWPEGHWNWPIKVTHKHAVRCGDMVWVGGQVDLSTDGEVLNPGDLQIQTGRVVSNFARVLDQSGCGLGDLVSLTCFYVNDGSVDEAGFLASIAAHLPAATRTTVTPVPVPCLAYPGMQVEIEGIAMRSEDGCAMPRSYSKQTCPGLLPEKFCTALRCGKMIFVSAQGGVDENARVVAPGDIVEQTRIVASHLEQALAAFGAGFDDVVKCNRWYAGGDDINDFEPAALAFAARFNDPGPAATGIPLPRHADPDMLIRIGLVAMLGEKGERLPRRHVWPDSLWDWHVHLPYKHGLKCDRMIFLGGQVSLDKRGRAVNPGDLSAQTHTAMKHIGTILNELGADYDDVCKLMTVYQGDVGAQALHANLPIRSSYFRDPGPATTGIPLPVLAYENMCVEIDVYAMADPD